MQVFITATPLETAQALDKLRLNKQIIECGQILDALNGAKAWSNHPCVLQYKGHETWLRRYKRVLEEVKSGCREGVKCKYHDFRARETTPPFHTQEYFDQMKRRLYTKNSEHYKQWAHLGRSDENWYWSPTENKFIKYINGKRIE